MYNYIESEYKKNSVYRKFSVLYYSIAILLYIGLIILGLFDFDKIFRSMFILLSILILIVYIIIFINLGYKFKDWKLFFKFKENNNYSKKRFVKKIVIL